MYGGLLKTFGLKTFRWFRHRRRSLFICLREAGGERGSAVNRLIAVIVIIIGALLISNAVHHKQQSIDTPGASSGASIPLDQSTPLSDCINNVDTWFGQNATTNIVAIALLSQKEQQVSECRVRYPTPASASNQSSLQSCLNDVDTWWNQTATTVGVGSYLLPLKNQMVGECQIKFPI